MISKRLNTILNMVDGYDRLIDVGCDHALLDIKAVTENKVNSAIAIDINEKALENAAINIEKYNAKNIVLLNQDGLKNVLVNPTDIVVISGLGTRTISKILSGHTYIKNIIIQSNNDIYELRKFMTKNYIIKAEKTVFEKGIYYVIILFAKGKKKYSFDELLFGPFLLKKDMKYLKYLLERYNKIYQDIPKKYFLKKYKYKLLIKIIEKNLK
jgi:tRNA (adenine22-N1)-methyltransferase